MAWNEESPANGLSVLSRYRNWSQGELGLDPGTANKRLNLIVSFYQWASRAPGNASASERGHTNRRLRCRHNRSLARSMPSRASRGRPHTLSMAE